MRGLILCCCLLLVGCISRGPAYTYDVSSRVVLLNATSPQARYYAFKAVTHEYQDYTVSWTIPQMVERYVRFSTPNSFIGYPAPGWLQGFDLNELSAVHQP